MENFELRNDLHTIEDYFSNSISVKKRSFEKKSIAYIANIDEPHFNVFLQRQPHRNLNQILSDVKYFFDQHHVPRWVYVVPNDIDTSCLQEALAQHDIVFTEKSSAMYYKFEPSLITSENSLTIEPANTNWNGFLQVMLEAFGGTKETISQYDQALKRAAYKNTNMHHFIGTLDQQPITTITLARICHTNYAIWDAFSPGKRRKTCCARCLVKRLKALQTLGISRDLYISCLQA